MLQITILHEKNSVKVFEVKSCDTFVIKSKEAGTALLTGVVEEDFWEDAEGGVWVLVSLPVANVKAQINAAIAATCADTSVFTGDSDKVVNEIMSIVDKVIQ